MPFKKIAAGVAPVLFGSFLLGGCAYMQDRGNDALDILNLGLSVNQSVDPQFALYIDFFSLTPLGYSGVESTAFGLGGRHHVGQFDLTSNNWGLLVWGSEQHYTGPFDPTNPYHARKDQADLTEAPSFDAGIIRLLVEENTPPVTHFFECNRILHLGWLGIFADIHPVELLDFVVGFTTLDIMSDDSLYSDAKATGPEAKDEKTD